MAINMGISCKALGDSKMLGNRYPVRNLGQASPGPGGPGAQGTPSPASPGTSAPSGGRSFDRSFERSFDFQNPFVWPGYPIVTPTLYPSTPPGTNCAWEKDSAGNDIYVCRPVAGAPPVVPGPQLYSVGPVYYPAQTVFAGLY